MYNKSMTEVKCYYCDQKATYTQPEKVSGIIIDVCEKHFLLKHMG